MSEPKAQWSTSQETAFGFVRRAVADGMSGRAGLTAYRAGGGHIGNEYWFSLYKSAFNINGYRETIKQVPMTYNVRDTMFTDVDFDFREEYVMQMKVRGWSEELGMNITKWVTAESDKIITKQEWLWGAQDAVESRIGSPPFVISRVLEWEAMHRSAGSYR